MKAKVRFFDFDKELLPTSRRLERNGTTEGWVWKYGRTRFAVYFVNGTVNEKVWFEKSRIIRKER